MLWEQRVGGSNPSAPTIPNQCGPLACGAWPLIDFLHKVGALAVSWPIPEVTHD